MLCVYGVRGCAVFFFFLGTELHFFPDLGTKDASFPLLVLLYLLWRIVRMGEMAVQCPVSLFQFWYGSRYMCMLLG